jgi:hypothetical protein
MSGLSFAVLLVGLIALAPQCPSQKPKPAVEQPKAEANVERLLVELKVSTRGHRDLRSGTRAFVIATGKGEGHMRAVASNAEVIWVEAVDRRAMSADLEKTKPTLKIMIRVNAEEAKLITSLRDAATFELLTIPVSDVERMQNAEKNLPVDSKEKQGKDKK